MKPTEYQRVEITSAEADYLTLGSWKSIAKGFEIGGYCHECDNINAVGVVAHYFLNLSIRCVTAEVKYKCCGNDSTISYAVLDEQLLSDVLTMSHK
jgi:hypothetical protein